MISMTDRICRHCGTNFQVRTALLKYGNRCRFCSRKCYHDSTLSPVQDRFLANVCPATSGCHEWLGTCDSYGYGVLTIKGQVIKAHRLAYTLYEGPIPPGKCVCHSCDNPECVNPSHLFIGSPADNAADSVAKGRNIKGERCHKAKLTAADVILIRRRYRNGETVKRLADEYGVHTTTIWKAASFRTWSHIS